MILTPALSAVINGRSTKISLHTAQAIQQSKSYKLRHTCATMLISAGVDINTVSRHMTQSSIVTTQQYFHLVNEKSREAAELIKLA